jgi:hypothetical protein
MWHASAVVRLKKMKKNVKKRKMKKKAEKAEKKKTPAASGPSRLMASLR